MASYQMKQRDPLLDQNIQAMLERRGKELFGFMLVTLALVFALMLWTYAADDPGWMVATDGTAKNALGRFGAAAASTLIIICGKGAWGIPLILFTWGVRFGRHIGEDRALGRLVFAVIAVALASIFAATHVPGATWTHSFGLGGLFGDTIVGALLGLLPMGAGVGLKALSLISGIMLITMAFYVTGFDKGELKVMGRFLIVGVIRSYGAAMELAQRLGERFVRSTIEWRARRAASGFAAGNVIPVMPLGTGSTHWTTMAPPPLSGSLHRGELGTGGRLRADPRYDALERAADPSVPGTPASREHFGEGQGLLRRLWRRPLPELMENDLSEQTCLVQAPSEDRVRARISDAIRSRSGSGVLSSSALVSVTAGLRTEPPVVSKTVTQQLSASMRDGDFNDHGSDRSDDVVAEGAGLDEPYEGDLSGPPVFEQDRLTSPYVNSSMPDGKPVIQQSIRKHAEPSRQAVSEAQPRLRFEDEFPVYEVPPLSLLTPAPTVRTLHLSNEALEENARMLESVLDDYGVKGEITSVRPGPVVTMYELEPAPGLKASRVIGLADDIARSMSALSARVSTVPGRTVIGIELPNIHREKVVLREILSARDFGDSSMRLPLALGKDIGGDPVVANLAKMPHLLIAGTTGSGKSVAINTMILSLLYKLTPEECRLIMIDPKMLELSVYDGIPHLLSPVVTDPKKAVVALKWVVGEMEERYRKMSRMGVRNIEGFNGRVREALVKGEMFKRTIQTGFDEDTGDPIFETDEFQPVTIPYIVVVVDEMADLMMVAGKEIEACIQRLAQMARASGIHLIMATQRPSVDVITGTIKANFPTRISFQVTSKIDSRTILGEQGAEQLLGMGDMLYMAGGAKITRIHGPFVSDEEVEEIVNHLKSFGPPVYMSGVVQGPEDDRADDIDQVLGLGGAEGDETLYDQAVAIVAKDRKCSTSYIQRKLGIGYNKAARLVEQMEQNSVVTSANHVGKREILLPEQ